MRAVGANSLLLMTKLLAFPPTSVENERAFSQIKLSMMDRRHKLCQGRLDGLLQIRLNGSAIKKFNPWGEGRVSIVRSRDNVEWSGSDKEWTPVIEREKMAKQAGLKRGCVLNQTKWSQLKERRNRRNYWLWSLVIQKRITIPTAAFLPNIWKILNQN